MKTSRCRHRTSLAGFISALLLAVSVDAANRTADAGGSCPGRLTLPQAIATAANNVIISGLMIAKGSGDSDVDGGGIYNTGTVPAEPPTLVPTLTCTPDWSPGADLPITGVGLVGVYFQANGKFYGMGGRSSDTAGNEFTHPFEYDPGSNSWTTKSATYPDIQVNNMACGVLSDAGTPYIYCVGGSDVASQHD